MWSNNETEEWLEQWYTEATITGVDGMTCFVLLSDTHDEKTEAEQCITMQAALTAVHIFDTHQIINPRPPKESPLLFQVLKISSNAQHRDRFSSKLDFTRLPTKAVWYNEQASDTEMKFLWQDLDDGCWCLGPTLQAKTYYTAKPASYPHEQHSWCVRHGDRIISLEICFKAYMKLPQQTLMITHPASTGGDGLGIAAAGAGAAAGAAAGATAGAVNGTAPGASRASPARTLGAAAGASRTSAAGSDGAAADTGHPASLFDDESDEDATEPLQAKETIILSYGRDNDKEGFCHATIESIDGNQVTYSCHKNRQGQLDGKSSGVLDYAQALLCRYALRNEHGLFIPHPHLGTFDSFYITHASERVNCLTGNYTATSTLMGDKPVFKKDKCTHYECTHAWRSPEGKWIIGKDNQMAETPNKGFAISEAPASWPHYIHRWFVNGHFGRIFSYSTKSKAITFETSSDSEVESAVPSESTSAAPCDAGSKQRTGDRERKAPARDRADPAISDKDKKRKRASGKSSGGSSTKARAAGGAAGAAGGADGLAAGDGMGVR